MKPSPRILILLSVLALGGLFFFPLWQITLEAPQYPGGITMYIWIYKITGDTEFTLQNINILNHYIGMQHIDPNSIPELKYFPWVVGGLMALGLYAYRRNHPADYTLFFAVLLLAGILGIADFYLWEYDYGHNLDPKAPIKVPGQTYQPPLIGVQYLLNFRASSWPALGGIGLGISVALSFWALLASRAKKLRVKPAHALGLLLLGLVSCSVESRPIRYGEETCAHCVMTIVDDRYGSQLVSRTGKVFSFDSMECLVAYMDEQPLDVKHIMATDYHRPGVLQPARELYYLISPEFPSPMGANLTAMADSALVWEHAESGGEVMRFGDLKDRF